MKYTKKLQSFFKVTALALALIILFTTCTPSYSLASNLPEQPGSTSLVTNENLDAKTVTDVTYQLDNTGDFINTNIERDHNTVEPTILPALPWIGMGVGQLLGWLAAGAAASITIYKFGVEVARVADFAKELSKNNRQDKPKYFKVKFDKEDLYVLSPIPDSDVVAYLLKGSSYDVWTPNMSDAKALATKFGNVIGPENHYNTGYNDTKYFYHYHGKVTATQYRTGHIFYGTSYRLGITRR